MDRSMPLVSIIIPVFNAAKTIQETLTSVKNQTYQNWECIIVDDHSTDGTPAIIKMDIAADGRFLSIINQRQKGAPGARNCGVDLSKGAYFIFLDADDLLGENCLTDRVNAFIQYPVNDFLVFSTLEFKSEISDTGLLINVPTKDDCVGRFLNLDVPWLTTGPIWKRESFLKLGNWNEDLLSWQDWELHLRALLNDFKFIFFSPVDNYWRCNYSEDSIGKNSTGLAHLRSHLKLAATIKPMMINNASHLARLNGLIAWIGARALEQGDTGLSVKAMFESHHNLNPIKTWINYVGIRMFKKQLIRHRNCPDFGTMRKVLFKTR